MYPFRYRVIPLTVGNNVNLNKLQAVPCVWRFNTAVGDITLYVKE
jgi:hypothetical protein